jgi:hypothetical protein
MVAVCTLSAVMSSACFGEGYGYGYGGGAAYSGAPVTTRAVVQPPAYHDRAFDAPGDLDTFVATETAGFVKEGALVSGRLDGFMPVPVTLQRGRCYRMVVRLEPGATFSEHARRGVAFVYHNGDRGMEVHGGPGIHGPMGGVASAGCPQQTAQAQFDIVANWGSAMDKSRVHDLGSGGVTMQLYSKPIDSGGLARLQADENRQIAEAEAFKREEERKKRLRVSRGCNECNQRYVECIADWRRGASRATCERERDSCAFTEAGLASARDCSR